MRLKRTNFIVLLFFLVLISCKKTNWQEHYREREKSPFGTFIMHNELNRLFDSEEIITLRKNFYDFFYDEYEESDEYNNFGSYICIKNDAYKLFDEGVTSLLSFVADGNTAFLSLNNFSTYLEEELQFTTENLDSIIYTFEKLKDLKGNFSLKNQQFNTNDYKFDRNIRKHYFNKYNDKTTIVLGGNEVNGKYLPNFIKIYHGKGAIYLHSNPVVFTNYYLLRNSSSYVENVFSYIPKSSRIIWDPQIRFSNYQKGNEKKDSIFKFFLQHDSLTWFLYISFAGLLLFMLFNARRKQRPIPEIEPLKNTTVAFAQTISSLYLKEENHKNLVNKKITYFLEKVRVKYLLDTSNLNNIFIENLAAKSGNNLQNTKYLVNTIIALHKKEECTKEELFVLHRMITNFFTNK